MDDGVVLGAVTFATTCVEGVGGGGHARAAAAAVPRLRVAALELVLGGQRDRGDPDRLVVLARGASTTRSKAPVV